MIEELREMAEEAKAAGLAVVVWTYPRGPMLDKTAETALDICAYAAHMAALVGAHIIKVKPPTSAISLDAAKSTYEKYPVRGRTTLSAPLQARGAGLLRRPPAGGVLGRRGQGDGRHPGRGAKAIHAAGGNGSIMGRNAFQRPKAEALKLLNGIIDIYKAPAD